MATNSQKNEDDITTLTSSVDKLTENVEKLAAKKDQGPFKRIIYNCIMKDTIICLLKHSELRNRSPCSHACTIYRGFPSTYIANNSLRCLGHKHWRPCLQILLEMIKKINDHHSHKSSLI